jgi:hypothetical protein
MRWFGEAEGEERRGRVTGKGSPGKEGDIIKLSAQEGG